MLKIFFFFPPHCYYLLLSHCLSSNLSLSGGQQWEFMETRASRSGTGSLMVRHIATHSKKKKKIVGCSASELNIVPHPPEFRYGKAPILIATDVASRGLGQYMFE